MSQQAVFNDAATAIDPYNKANTFISYYTYGSVIGLVMDLSIRKNFPDKGLDDVMKYMWDHFGKPEIPYQIKDLEHALAKVCKDSEFAANFFNNYIYGHDLPDLKELLAEFGLDLRIKNPGQTLTGNLNGELRNRWCSHSK